MFTPVTVIFKEVQYSQKLAIALLHPELHLIHNVFHLTVS